MIDFRWLYTEDGVRLQYASVGREWNDVPGFIPHNADCVADQVIFRGGAVPEPRQTTPDQECVDVADIAAEEGKSAPFPEFNEPEETDPAFEIERRCFWRDNVLLYEPRGDGDEYTVADLEFMQETMNVLILKEENERFVANEEELWPDELVSLTGDAPGWEPPEKVEEAKTLETLIRAAVNFHGRESVSNTPDFILADYLIGCLHSYENAVQNREFHANRFAVDKQANPVPMAYHEFEGRTVKSS